MVSDSKIVSDNTEQEKRPAHRPTVLVNAKPRKLSIQDGDFDYLTGVDPATKYGKAGKASPGLREVTEFHRGAMSKPIHHWDFLLKFVADDGGYSRNGCLPINCIDWDSADEQNDTITVNIPGNESSPPHQRKAILSSLTLNTIAGRLKE